MSSSAAGKRSWKCPECGTEELLSVTQLDPIACDVCLERMRGGNSSGSGTQTSGPLGIWQSLPEITKLVIVAIAFITGFLLGLTLGFLAGKSVSPPPVVSSDKGTASPALPVPTAKEEERPDPPGPGYKWVRGRQRKDGTRGPGYWAKDPHYKGEKSSSTKK
ncbi:MULTISPECIES: hypothetical protein [unclassified Schlesneria]|uniref:hypothetical protein n=1 Tax=Schlesneria TaxID=656899 RepID=UPI002F21C705